MRRLFFIDGGISTDCMAATEVSMIVLTVYTHRGIIWAYPYGYRKEVRNEKDN